MEARIVHIRRTNHRIVKITLRSEESQMPVTVINTYAPHQGKTKVEQAEHWKLVHGTVKNTPSNTLRYGAQMQAGKWGNKTGRRKAKTIFRTIRKE